MGVRLAPVRIPAPTVTVTMTALVAGCEDSTGATDGSAEMVRSRLADLPDAERPSVVRISSHPPLVVDGGDTLVDGLPGGPVVVSDASDVGDRAGSERRRVPGRTDHGDLLLCAVGEECCAAVDGARSAQS
ncbi:hypothetical protein [Parafrankia sp. FMc2]|uniref:hypothetical protein n=1 Tax=Parafrankia sp. FMc2 TaxID=3233196 RepID=UPI0034D6091F